MLSSLSLRARFLITPLIGVILTLIVYVTSNEIITSQHKLFQKINDTDLIQISEINHSTAQLAKNNSEIIALLLGAESLDEEQIYQQGKIALSQLHQIEQNLQLTIEGSERIVLNNIDMFNEIEAAFSDYHSESVSAIEMASVDPSQALYELSLANQKLKELNTLFYQLSEYHLQHMTLKAGEIKGSLTEKTYIDEISVVLILLMIIIAYFLSYKISANLSQVKSALVSLSQGNTDIEVLQKEDDYIQHLWRAVGDFKKSLLINQQQKNELLQLKYAINQHSIISITNLAGDIVYINKKFSELSGYSKEEATGKNLKIIDSQNKPQSYWQDMLNSISKGDTWHDEVLNKAKNNDLYWLDMTVIPVKESLGIGEITGYMTIGTDITDRKEQEQKLIEAKSIAEAATKTKSQFLATMSHEIRTPMNGVIGMTQLLQDTPLNNEQKDYLNAISRSGNNLLEIINDILDFSKLDFDAVKLEAISFNLERVGLECLEGIANNSTDIDVEFIFDYQPDLPRHFIGDPARIRQILINLVGNAAKFTKQGHINLRIFESPTLNKEEAITIEVQDTGIGIKEEALSHLFDEFSQADSSTTREFGGTGLGLSITKKLVTLMKGQIAVTSIFQQGTTFSISIPLIKNNNPSLPPMKTIEGLKTLLLDENSDNRRIFKQSFDHMGAKTTVCINEKDVLPTLHRAIADKHPYQILVLGISFQNENSIALAKQIRSEEQFNNLKLLAFPASPKKGDAKHYEALGFDAYLTKLSNYETIQHILSATNARKKGQAIITQHTIEDITVISADKQSFKGTILLVEDIRVNQIIAKNMLTKMGLAIDVANNGQEAVEAFSNNQYDLIFMDCHMPIMDGYQATIEIRQLEQNQKLTATPIIALTANATKEDKIICQQSQMDDVVTKPYQVIDLQKSLKKWLPESIERDPAIKTT